MSLDLVAPAAPETDASRLAWLRLARSRNVGPASFRRLLARYGGAARALEALPDLAARGGARAYQACSERQGCAEMERAAAVGAKMLCLGAQDYPPRLGEIHDPPAFLWALGDLKFAQRPAVAVVGARNASSLGLRMARKLSGELGERGWIVVSGFARGVDAAAHTAALETGSIAALAGGVDHIYPEENAALHASMVEKGLLVSEAPIGMVPQARHFPRRNRIVSGLSEGVIVVEAAEKSGTLITARCALDQGREVMAVPGAPLDPRSGGCNDLIRQGAALIRTADDVDEALAAPRALVLEEAPMHFRPLSELEEDPDLADVVAGALGPAPIGADEIARDLCVAPAQLSAALLELELAGRLERHPGGMISLRPAED